MSLREWGLERFFEVVITGVEVSTPKPHPEGILLAMEQMKAIPAETIYVGDSHADVIAGGSAGLTTAKQTFKQLLECLFISHYNQSYIRKYYPI
ncbi:HAD family hydrolase [Brevibacillus invocatus]|uniref:HAD family hydrolase n=1 Tax=Brevibacillus invocatus TaxID=173959 RepID=A0A3M8BUG7_9BACL|nr:HAD family hydrolase [Brevibacillus invocatus]